MENSTSNQPNLDDVIGRFNNILKDKNIDLGKILNDENNNENRLLQSLKPFLNDSKKQKLDEYIKIANILVVMNIINEMNSLYLILIIILITK